MKYSRQRELILNTVLCNKIHPTADEVYSLIKKEIPNISLGTVYRNLNLLATNGDIVKISVANSSDRFDGEKDPHYHMICRDCGNVFDVDLDFLGELDRHIMNQTGFEVTQHDLMIWGNCKGCREKSQNHKRS